jgi:hypothetical protein
VNSRDVGEVAEMECQLALKREGWTILEPFGHEQPYDFVAEKNGEFKRVQSKNGRLDSGSIDVTVCTYGSSGGVRTYSEDEIDSFGVYCPETDSVYLVPVEEAPNKNMRLRVEQSDSHNVRMATEYKL